MATFMNVPSLLENHRKLLLDFIIFKIIFKAMYNLISRGKIYQGCKATICVLYFPQKIFAREQINNRRGWWISAQKY